MDHATDRPYGHAVECPAHDHDGPGCTLWDDPEHHDPAYTRRDDKIWLHEHGIEGKRNQGRLIAMAAEDLPCPRCGRTDTDFFHGDAAHCRDCGHEWMQPREKPDVPDYPPSGEYHHLQFPGMPPSKRAYPVIRAQEQRNHEDMSDAEMRAHMRDRHGFIDSPEDPDWLIADTHREEHADAPLEHSHPDLERWPEEETLGDDQLPLSDRDFLHQHGIEASRMVQ